MIDTMNLPRPAPRKPRQQPEAELAPSATPTAPAAPAPPATMEAVQHSEGKVAMAIEQQTAKLPSDVFLWSALATMGVSLALQASGKKNAGLVIGQWTAPLLLFGVYNKLVKIAGSDRIHDQSGVAV